MHINFECEDLTLALSSANPPAFARAQMISRSSVIINPSRSRMSPDTVSSKLRVAFSVYAAMARAAYGKGDCLEGRVRVVMSITMVARTRIGILILVDHMYRFYIIDLIILKLSMYTNCDGRNKGRQSNLLSFL